LVAVVAGILMQGAFRDEMPLMGTLWLHWMVAGVATFMVLAILTG